MTMVEHARPAACPACSVTPLAEELVQVDTDAGQVLLSLPTVHCAGCISTVERGLSRIPGVRSARVNLTLRRASVDADPDVTADQLIEALDGLGYPAHELDAGILSTTATEKAGRDLLVRLAVAGFAAMNVMLLSVSVWSGAADATRDLFHWISAAITLPTIAFSGQPFFRNAFKALSARHLNMDVPISLAIVLAAGMSLYETTQSGYHAYYDAALSLTFFLLAGRYLDHRTRAVARSAAEELAALEVPRAARIGAQGEETVAISDLIVGDIVRVRPGGRLPVDGVVRTGASEIDRSVLTGETLPIYAGPGTSVSAGEVNLTGPLEVEVTAAGSDSSLHRMADLVAVAESAKNRYTSLADRAAAIYAPGVHLLAFFAFVGWLVASGDLRLSLNIAVAVLIITCPCALGLAVPAVSTAASGRLFRRGLLIKHGTALERLAEVDTVVFDKTGTLTMGQPVLRDTNGYSEQVMAMALAMTEGSAHPLAQAIVRATKASGQSPVVLSSVTEIPGHGIEAIYEGQRVRFGRGDWLGAPAMHETTAWLKLGKQEPICFAFDDTLRPGAETLIAALKEQGKSIHLLSGDATGPVRNLAERVGIDNWQAELLPEGKVAVLDQLSANGARALMVGDGLNDTAALAAAHVSIAPASALDAARVASDIVLLGEDLAPLADALVTARRATRRILENFAIAAGYNAIAIPIALAEFATPLAAALAMSASSIMVSLNALRLR